ncbi:MAG: serine hydroxymethyltransferase [Pseudomonadota bacterium]
MTYPSLRPAISPLKATDPELYDILQRETQRQEHTINLTASENTVAAAVMEAQGSSLTNKYAEGYPGRRYYGGCRHADEAETLAIERCKALFKSDFANVQPNSGSQANQAVFLAILNPGDTILSLDLAAGGHLTHGAPINLSGRWFNIAHYSVDPQTHLLDYEAMAKLAKQAKPKLIIAGASAYPRTIDFARMRKIADEVDAYLLADISHIAGLVVSDVHPSPFPHAHVATSTTHKTLRGPRGGLIVTNDEALAKKIDSAIFPGMQGGPMMHTIAAKAVAFGLALKPDFADYSRQVVKNAVALANALTERGYSITSGGTDNHLMLLDLRAQDLTGKQAEAALEDVGIVSNKNGVPGDPRKPWVTSGVRFGTPTITSRGFDEAAASKVGHLIADVVDSLQGIEKDLTKTSQDVQELCKAFPLFDER